MMPPTPPPLQGKATAQHASIWQWEEVKDSTDPPHLLLLTLLVVQLAQGSWWWQQLQQVLLPCFLCQVLVLLSAGSQRQPLAIPVQPGCSPMSTVGTENLSEGHVPPPCSPDTFPLPMPPTYKTYLEELLPIRLPGCYMHVCIRTHACGNPCLNGIFLIPPAPCRLELSACKEKLVVSCFFSPSLKENICIFPQQIKNLDLC